MAWIAIDRFIIDAYNTILASATFRLPSHLVMTRQHMAYLDCMHFVYM